jgi:hypothetical protein
VIGSPALVISEGPASGLPPAGPSKHQRPSAFAGCRWHYGSSEGRCRGIWRPRMEREITCRMYTCANCHGLCFVCSVCDRGWRYCRECSAFRRMESVLRAGRTYQRSLEGRLAHAARQARYRARSARIVTHQCSPGPCGCDDMPPREDLAEDVASQEVPMSSAAYRHGELSLPGPVRNEEREEVGVVCWVCGKHCSQVRGENDFLGHRRR